MRSINKQFHDSVENPVLHKISCVISINSTGPLTCSQNVQGAKSNKLRARAQFLSTLSLSLTRIEEFLSTECFSGLPAHLRRPWNHCRCTPALGSSVVQGSSSRSSSSDDHELFRSPGTKKASIF